MIPPSPTPWNLQFLLWWGEGCIFSATKSPTVREILEITVTSSTAPPKSYPSVKPFSTPYPPPPPFWELNPPLSYCSWPTNRKTAVDQCMWLESSWTVISYGKMVIMHIFFFVPALQLGQYLGMHLPEKTPVYCGYVLYSPL